MRQKSCRPRSPSRPRMLIRLAVDTAGATMIEFTLVVVILLSVTFGIVEFGLVMWQHNATVKASTDGVRHAVQSDPVAPAVTAWNAVIDGGLEPGQALNLPEFTIRCDATACTCAAGDCSALGAPGHDAAAFAAIVAAMRPSLPFLTDAEVTERVFVEYTHVGMGFAGRPGPDIVPLVSVGLDDHTYDFVAMNAFGLNTVPINAGRATMPAEDLSSAWPP